MGPAGEGREHLLCLLGRVGLAHDLPVQDHDGVGGDDKIVLACLPENGCGLAGADIRHGLRRGQLRADGLVNVGGEDCKREIQLFQQLAPPGGLGTQYDGHDNSYSTPR